MTDTAFDLDELKQVWQSLDRRLARQEALMLDGVRRHRLDGLRAALRPLRWGQRLQIPFGVLVVVWAVWTWRTRWDLVNVRVAAMIMHAYGVALIVAGAQTLTLLGRIDYTAPVVEIQRRIAGVQRWYSLTGLVLGMAWWLLWIPLVMMVAGAAGRDVLARGPWAIGGYAAVCVVGLALSLWAVWRAERSNRPAIRAWAQLTASGRSLARAERILGELRRWEADADEDGADAART